MPTSLPGKAGGYHRQPGGYTAFIPARLPFAHPLQYSDRMLSLLSRADQAVGRLDAAAMMLPNPDLFVGMYVRKESVLNSQIEGVTQASLSEVVEHEARLPRRRVPAEVAEVINHVNALNYGLERLSTLPVSNRLIRELHERLMHGVRGAERSPGEFRDTQNWIGPPGSDLSNAAFVPPPPAEMLQAMGSLESFLHDETPMPPLVKAGLVHYQFETIHPFLDGNGRLGRLLVTFYLCQRQVLRRPLLYLSEFVKAHKDEYYERLQAVRDRGDLEEWVAFFLTAVLAVAEAAAGTCAAILELRKRHRMVVQQSRASVHGLQALDALFQRPFIAVRHLAATLGVSYPTANSLVATFTDCGILEETSGRARNRLFAYRAYLGIMEGGLGSARSGVAAP